MTSKQLMSLIRRYAATEVDLSWADECPDDDPEELKQARDRAWKRIVQALEERER